MIAYTTGVARGSPFQSVGGTSSVPPDIIDVEIVGPPINYTVGLGHVAGALIFDKFPSLPAGNMLKKRGS